MTRLELRVKNRIRRNKLPRRVFATGRNGKLERHPRTGKRTYRLMDTVQVFKEGNDLE